MLFVPVALPAGLSEGEKAEMVPTLEVGQALAEDSDGFKDGPGCLEAQHKE